MPKQLQTLAIHSSCAKTQPATRTVIWFLSFLDKFGEGAPPAGNMRLYQAETYARIINWASVQFSSVAQSCPLFETPWTAARQTSLSITNSQSSLRLRSIESVMPSSYLILCRPLLLLPQIPPSIRVFSNESTLRMRWTKYWNSQIPNDIEHLYCLWQSLSF